ncbi:MAG: restriction endonuclease [Candidatus Ventricola sp.]
MAKRKKKRRSLLLRLADALLSAIDFLCERFSQAAVALIAGVFRGLAWLLRGVFRGLLAMARAAGGALAGALRRLTAGRSGAQRCLRLDGPEFEAYVALVLRDNGFKHVALTKGSGDQGVDILAERNGRTYAIQCKNYEGAVGNFAVQEAYAGAQFYGCDKAAVICPGEFTRGAKELAGSTGVLLWDGRKLSHMMKISGRRPHHRKPA